MKVVGVFVVVEAAVRRRVVWRDIAFDSIEVSEMGKARLTG
jgi:hypothetical protein